MKKSNMTVKDLRAALKGLPDGMLVVLAKDSEGNDYSPLYEVDGDNNTYLPESAYNGDVGITTLTKELKDNGYTDEDVAEDGKDCVVLWPTN